MLVWQQARRDAEAVARAYCNREDFPRDIEAIIEKVGIDVVSAPLTEETSGLIIKRDEFSDPQIYVDSTEPRVRQRFTLAHELGHYFERANADDMEYSFLDRRGSDHYDLHEFYADEFAGTLLMPEDEIERLQKDGAEPVEMASHFGVSVAAVNMRLKRLNIARRVSGD